MVISSPAVGADDTVYIGSADGNVYALGGADGGLKWTFVTGRVVGSSQAVGASGMVYVASRNSSVYALNPTDGSIDWSFQTVWGPDFSSPALGADGTAYVGAWFIYAITADGQERWHFQAADSIDSSPAIGSDGTVYVGGEDGYVYAFSP